jgi:hypothetical protein
MPLHTLFEGAEEICAVGLSLNLLCQQYSGSRLYDIVRRGAKIRCAFLDPHGKGTKDREAEEGYPSGHLSTLTQLNMDVVLKIRDQLPDSAKERMAVVVYDQTIRYNVVIIDSRTCIMQPYMPDARGVDSPTFVIERQPGGGGLFDTFSEFFESRWRSGRPV